MVNQSVEIDGTDIWGVKSIVFNGKTTAEHAVATILVANTKGMFTNTFTLNDLVFKSIIITVDGSREFAGFVIDLPEQKVRKGQNVSETFAQQTFSFCRIVTRQNAHVN